MTAPIINVRDLSVVLDDKQILREVSLDVVPGEVVALAGPSGSGKSTLLRVVLGLTAPSAGTLSVGERVVSQGGKILVAPEDRNLAMVFQDLALWPHLTVTGNLEFALRSRGVSRREREDRIRAVLERTGLLDKASRRPATLSGGERQRVALARALVQQPVALLLDEPLASLDVLLRVEMLSFLRELLRDRRCPVLYVTHDGSEAAALADRVVVLEGGRVAQQGTIAELLAAPSTAFVRAFVERRRPAGE
jgi:iron(III) transport system ATP-binding protein